MKLKTSFRAMAMLICMVMLLSLAGTAFASVNVTPASGYAIATAAVNVRSGPDSSYSVLGWLQQGSLANVSGILNTGWIQISYGNGYGYVNSSYMNISQVVTGTSPIPTAVPPVVPVPTAVPVITQPVVIPQPVTNGANQFYVNAARLNVRSGPSSRSSVLGVLSRGQVVTKLGKSGNWTQIQLTSGVGYVYTKYITAYGSSVPTAPVQPVVPGSSVYYDYCYATTALNIRSGPGEQYSVIGMLYASSVVRRISVSGNYTRIQVANGSVAYVMSAYLMNYTGADAASRVVYPTTNNTFSTYPSYPYYGGCNNRCYTYGYKCPYCGKCNSGSSNSNITCSGTSCGKVYNSSYAATCTISGSGCSNGCNSGCGSYYYSGYPYWYGSGSSSCSSCSN